MMLVMSKAVVISALLRLSQNQFRLATACIVRPKLVLEKKVCHITGRVQSVTVVQTYRAAYAATGQERQFATDLDSPSRE